MRINSEYLLIEHFLFKMMFLRRKENNDYFLWWLALRFMHLSVCYQWMYAFSTEFWASRMELLWNNFLDFHVSWASMTTKMLLQRVQKMEVTRCEVRAVGWIFKTAPSKLLQQGYHMLGCVGSWHQVTYRISRTIRRTGL